MTATLQLDRTYPHSVDHVWAVMTRPASMARWLGADDFRLEVGHRFTVSGPRGPDFGGRVQCRVVAIHAPTALHLQWDAGPVQGQVRFELEAVAEGTRLTLSQTGFEDRQTATFAAMLAIWHEKLDHGLAELLGAPVGPPAATAGLGGPVAGIVAGLGLAAVLAGVWLVTAQTKAHTVAATSPTAAAPEAELASDATRRPEGEPIVTSYAAAPFRPTTLPGPGTTEDDPLVLSIDLDGAAFLAHAADHAGAALQSAVFDRLVEPDGHGGWTSAVVARTEVWPAAVTLTLHPDIRWHDEAPLTAEDVCHSATVAFDPRLRAASCEADGLTARLTYDGPLADPLEPLDTLLLPAHHRDAILRPDSEFRTRPVGTGPYQALRGRRSIRLTAWDNPHHEALLRHVVVQDSGDPFVNVRTAIRGGVHAALDLGPYSFVPTVDEAEGVEARRWDPGTETVLFAASRGPLEDARLRRAVEAVLDRADLRGLVTGELAGELRGVPGAEAPRPGADPTVDDQLTALGAVQVGGRWQLDGAPIQLDVVEARGVRAIRAAEQLRNQLVAHGLGAEVSPAAELGVEPMLWPRSQRAHDADLVIAELPVGRTADLRYLTDAHPAQPPAAELSRHLDAVRDAPDPARRAAAQADLEQFLADQALVIGLWKDQRWMAAAAGLHTPMPARHILRDLDEWRWTAVPTAP